MKMRSKIQKFVIYVILTGWLLLFLDTWLNVTGFFLSMHSKTRVIVFLVICALLLIYYFRFENKSTNQIPAKRNRIDTVRVTGIIRNILANRYEDADGLEVEADGTIYPLNFPPHLAVHVLNTVNKGDLVEAEFDPIIHYPHESPLEGHYHLLSVINKKNKKKIEISKLKDPLLSSGKDIELIVTNFKIKYDKSGEPFGIAFKNYLIDIKPHILKNFTSLLDSVTTVKINGILRDPSSGFINLGSYTVVTAISIEIENKHYMLM